MANRSESWNELLALPHVALPVAAASPRSISAMRRCTPAYARERFRRTR
ncbi:hypothetical protein [Haladaptatus salinisoli]|nr:hypothetical protein [Haladaptatus salinisoli]